MKDLIKRVQQQLDNNHAVEAVDIERLLKIAKSVNVITDKINAIDENQFTTPTDVKHRAITLVKNPEL